MSRTAVAARRIDPAELSDMPTIKGAAGVIEFAREQLGVTLTPSLVRRATEARKLRVTKVSTRNTYSELDIYLWIKSMGQGGNSEQAR